MGQLDGKVAFITGAARGQGRSHAVRLARAGADVIAVDICADVPTVPYDGPTEADLAETVKEVEALDRRIVVTKADVSDLAALKVAVDDGVARLGRLDIVCANAGIASHAPSTAELTEEQWETMIGINLSGVWRTTKVAIPHLIAGGRGGSIIITSSTAGLKGFPGLAHYAAAKHGVVGLMRTLALELAPHMIRVNTIHPANVNTAMIQNEDLYRLFDPDRPNKAAFENASREMQALPIPWVEPADISNAVLFLASDEGRYVTGVTFPVDGGMTIK